MACGALDFRSVDASPDPQASASILLAFPRLKAEVRFGDAAAEPPENDASRLYHPAIQAASSRIAECAMTDTHAGKPR